MINCYQRKHYFYLTFLFLVLISSALMGDVIRLKNGSSLEGKILAEEEAYIEIQTKYGKVKVERSRILEVVHVESKEAIYERMIHNLDRKDPDSLFNLALWCKENEKKADYRRYLRETLKLDPNHAGANREKGKVLYDGKWFTEEGLKKYHSSHAEEMRAKGMVLYLDEWVTEEEMQIQQGFMDWEGALVPGIVYLHKLANRDLAQFFEIPFNITDSEHFSIRSTHQKELHPELLETCENLYGHFLRTFTPNGEEQNRIERLPIPIYILPQTEHCLHFINSGYQRRYKTAKDKVLRFGPVTSFSYSFPKPFIVMKEAFDPNDPRDIPTLQNGYLTHHLGHILLHRFKGGDPIPPWIERGVSLYYEGMGNYFQTLTFFRYNDKKDQKNRWVPDWSNFLEWRKNLTDPDRHEFLPTLSELFQLDELDFLDSRDMAKAWSVTAFLLKEHRPAFLDFIRMAGSMDPGKEPLPQEKAWARCFPDHDPHQMEIAWRDWALDQPIGPSRKERLTWEE